MKTSWPSNLSQFGHYSKYLHSKFTVHTYYPKCPMGEIIQLHVGQAGVQIANACWELYCLEHGIKPDGSLCECPCDTAFRSFFQFQDSNKVTPRAVLIDSEPTVIDQVRTGPYGHLYSPGSLITGKEDSGSNFARGYCTMGEELIDITMEAIRLVAESCCNLKGFMMFRSIGGGTGSGLGNRIAEQIQIEYEKVPKMEFIIFPSPCMSPLIVEPYNALLATHCGMDAIDCSCILDNEALYDICATKLNITAPKYKNLNRIIGQAVSTFTSSQRFSGSSNVTFSEFLTNLVPYPRIHFPVVGYAPFIPGTVSGNINFSTDQITNACFEPCNQLVRCNPADGKNMTCVLLYRGRVSSSDIYASMSHLKAVETIRFVDWSPTGFKVGMNMVLPFSVPCGGLGNSDKALVTFSNNTIIQKVWCRLIAKYNRLYSRRAFIHHYITEGFEEDAFKEAAEDICALIADYMEVDKAGTKDDITVNITICEDRAPHELSWSDQTSKRPIRKSESHHTYDVTVERQKSMDSDIDDCEQELVVKKYSANDGVGATDYMDDCDCVVEKSLQQLPGLQSLNFFFGDSEIKNKPQETATKCKCKCHTSTSYKTGASSKINPIRKVSLSDCIEPRRNSDIVRTNRDSRLSQTKCACKCHKVRNTANKNTDADACPPSINHRESRDSRLSQLKCNCKCHTVQNVANQSIKAEACPPSINHRESRDPRLSQLKCNCKCHTVQNMANQSIVAEACPPSINHRDSRDSRLSQTKCTCKCQTVQNTANQSTDADACPPCINHRDSRDSRLSQTKCTCKCHTVQNTANQSTDADVCPPCINHRDSRDSRISLLQSTTSTSTCDLSTESEAYPPYVHHRDSVKPSSMKKAEFVKATVEAVDSVSYPKLSLPTRSKDLLEGEAQVPARKSRSLQVIYESNEHNGESCKYSKRRSQSHEPCRTEGVSGQTCVKKCSSCLNFDWGLNTEAVRAKERFSRSSLCHELQCQYQWPASCCKCRQGEVLKLGPARPEGKEFLGEALSAKERFCNSSCQLERKQICCNSITIPEPCTYETQPYCCYDSYNPCGCKIEVRDCCENQLPTQYCCTEQPPCCCQNIDYGLKCTRNTCMPQMSKCCAKAKRPVCFCCQEQDDTIYESSDDKLVPMCCRLPRRERYYPPENFCDQDTGGTFNGPILLPARCYQQCNDCCHEEQIVCCRNDDVICDCYPQSTMRCPGALNAYNCDAILPRELPK